MIAIDPAPVMTLHQEIASSVPQLLSALVGGCIAFAASWSTNRAALIRQREQLEEHREENRASDLRNKGEELYVLAQRWIHGFAGQYLHTRSVMQGKITYNQALDEEIKSGRELVSRFDFGRMELLIEAYFPDTKNAYARISAARDNIALIKQSHKTGYVKGETDGSSYIPSWDQAHKDLDAASLAFKESILTELRKI